MTLQGSQRRGFRRRLLNAASAPVQPEPGGPPARPGRTTPYSREAWPEHHPALATLLPTRAIGLAATCIAIIATIAALIVLAATLDRWLPRSAVEGSPRAETVDRIRDCLSMAPRTGGSAWLGQLMLLSAACIAVSIRQMRRHRLDDYRGRYRAWGWIAVLAVAASLERQIPLGPLVSSAVANGTGISLGPSSAGWWLCLAIPPCLATVLWAVLPLHERLLTGLATFATGLAWIAATGFEWLADRGTSPALAIAPGGLTLAGDGLFAIAMLVAARSVLREVRGESSIPEKDRQPTPPVDREDGATETDVDTAETSTEWLDGSDAGDRDADGEADDDPDRWQGGERRLSKAERKRLRKLARTNRAA